VFEPLRRLARWRRRHPVLPLIGDTRTRAEREANALRTTVKALGAELVGVSVDTVKTQCAFAEKEAIHFPLLGDEERTISKAYDVLWPVLNVDRRVTYIIDPQGRIETVIRHEVRVYKHLDDVLRYLTEHPLPAAGT